MAEYIKKEAAIRALLNDSPEQVRYSREYAADCIRYMDAADVAPVRHGRWEWCKDYDGDSILVCSECGRVCHEEDAPYCYCGAKMDGGFDNG